MATMETMPGTRSSFEGTGFQNTGSGSINARDITFVQPYSPKNLLEECLRSLSFPEMQDRPNDIDHPAEGTCEWFSRHPMYQEWATCHHGLLWVKGKPGSGKSTLLRKAVDDALEAGLDHEILILSFFFHGRGIELQKNPLGLFRSLLYQLLRCSPDALTHLVTTFTDRCDTRGKPGKDWNWHLRELQNSLTASLAQVVKYKPVCLFIDALDECGEENAVELVRVFKSVIEHVPSTSFQLHICFSCRHYPILDLDTGFQICLEQENFEDISTYVKSQFAAVKSSTIPPTMAGTIVHGASGVFMWAYLVIRRTFELERRGMGWKRIEAEIKTTPPDLDSLYQELLLRMDDKPASLRLIQWICFAYRPLSPEELRWAMTFDLNCQYQSLLECQDSPYYVPDTETMARQIQTLSCGLAEIVFLSHGDIRTEWSADVRSSDAIVQFIHQSVQDFFIKKGISTLDNTLSSAGLIDGAADYYLSRSCIHYLAMKEIRESDAHYDIWGGTLFPLMDYALAYWLPHARRLEILGLARFDFLEFFSWPSEELLQAFLSSLRRQHGNWPLNTTMIHFLSHCNLIRPLRTILRQNQINCKDASGQTPLSIAARKGHPDVIELLLNTGEADVNTKENNGRTPLSHAVACRDESMVKLLLTIGQADINTKDNHNRTPLSRAADRGDKNIVKLLLDTGQADVNPKDKDNRTPLLWAAFRGDESIVKLLLDTGEADVNTKDNEGRTPLSLAAYHGNESIVKLLLATGQADVNTKDNHNRTPLSYTVQNMTEGIIKALLATGQADVDTKDRRTLWTWAVGKGRKDIVQLLLKHQVEFDKIDDGQTPLSLAVKGGEKGIVELFLNKGPAAVETKDMFGRTPVWAAATAGNAAVLQLLLASGKVEVNMTDDNGRTPLWWAAASGHGAVVRLLLATGRVEVDKEDRFGRSALWWAKNNGHEVIVRLLKGHQEVVTGGR